MLSLPQIPGYIHHTSSHEHSYLTTLRRILTLLCFHVLLLRRAALPLLPTLLIAIAYAPP